MHINALPALLKSWEWLGHKSDDHFLTFAYLGTSISNTHAAEPFGRIMSQIQTNRSAFFITVLVIALAIGVEKYCCAGSLVTTPPALGGVLTSCGDARLTCSHDNVDGENTRWRITATDSSLMCQEIINHNFPTIPYGCSEFRFEDITALSGAISALNSTAVVNPLPLDLNGSQMECIAGSLSTSPLVGSVTLCVIGKCTQCVNLIQWLI